MSLSDWYSNRELLLTGVTSDVGRALLEKILRSFRNVKVYVILRSRNGFNKDDRINNILQSPRFERLRQEDPNAISRVKSLEGNLLYDHLAISKDNKELLQNVTVAFHAAGPPETMFDFCQDLPRLKVMVVVTSIFRHKGQISESLQNETLPEGPIALVRVPLVGPAYREPMPGFMESLKGPAAFMVGAGLTLGNSELQAEIVPVDMLTNTLIGIAWDKDAAKNEKASAVYNIPAIGCTWEEVIEKARRGNRKFPYPTFGFRGMTNHATVRLFLVLLFEWLPSLICDKILGFVKVEKRLVREYERVRNALRSVESISSRPWSAERNRVYQLRQRLTPEDQDAFPFATEIDVESYVLCTCATARKHCVDSANIKMVTNFRILFVSFVAFIFIYALFSHKINEIVKQRVF